MKLLICTQALDKNHPILGFFHRWVEEFAKHCEVVHVICLVEGEHTLPKNVHVHSLGKEFGKNRVRELWRFYTYLWQLRREYDSVFVHMNQIYVILGAPVWRALGKRVGLWYAHGTVSCSLKVAVHLAHTVFTSTAQGMRVETPKRKIVHQGIDTDTFCIDLKKTPNTTLELITVGRLSPSKNVETLLQACATLKQQNVPFRFTVIGGSSTDAERAYEKGLRELAATLGLGEAVVWRGPVPQAVVPQYLQAADVFIHDGDTGSLDKALLEAASCGCVVVSSNAAYRAFSAPLAPDFIYDTQNDEALAEKLQRIAQMSHKERVGSMEALVAAVKNEHGILKLIQTICQEYV